MYNNETSKASPTKQNAEQILEKFVLELVVEQRRKRRWGIFFKLVFLAIVLLFIWGLFPWDSMGPHSQASHVTKQKHIAQIVISGEINADNGVNAEDTIQALDDAADDKNTQAIILDINSPGGSPVQASYIYNEIRRLQKQHKNMPIDAVCQDLCASAAYYIASASNQIYANPTSLVGSIGVLMDSFGFVDSLKKIGATRRLYTAGKYKGFMDPFSPITQDEEGFLHTMLDSDHQIFINDVKAGRGNRLKNDPNLFSGLVWNGVQAKQLGLIDDFGSLADVAREHYHNEHIIDFTVKHNYFQLMLDRFGASFWHQFSMEVLTKKLS